MTGRSSFFDFRPAALPGSADRLLAAVLIGLVAAMAGGLVLGLAGAYWPPIALGFGLVAAIVAWARGGADDDLDRSVPGWWVLIVLGVVLGITALHAANSGQHLIVDRDPGVYATTGLWLAENDSPVVETRFSDFGRPEGINPTSLAFPTHDNGETLEPQFPHGFPVVLSFAAWAFGDAALFVVNPLLIGLALMCIFAVGARLAGPAAGASAAIALGLNPVQAHFGRDTYSEILAQALIWGGLWLILRAWRSHSAGPPLIAGVVFGGATLVRLDTAIIFVPIALATCCVLLAKRHRGDPGRSRAVENSLWIALGAVAAALLAVIQTRMQSISYYWSLEGRLIDLAQVTIAIAALGALAIALSPAPFNGSLRLARRMSRPAAALTAGIVFIAGLFAWFVRPRIETDLSPVDGPNPLIGFLQRRAGVPEDPLRTYFEQTMVWLEWYLGAPVLAIALVGVALACGYVVRKGFPVGPTLAAAMVVLTAALYLRDPQITPDQIWAMRRFLPVVIPGLFLGAAAVSAAMIAWRGVGSRPSGVVGAIGLIGVPLWQAVDVHDESIREHHGSLSGVQAICQEVDSRSGLVLARPAVNLPTYEENIHLHLAPALRGVCDVPVTGTDGPLGPERALEIAAALEASGRRLVVLSSDDRPFARAPRPPGTRKVTDFTYQRLRLQVESRPHEPAGRRIRAWATPVAPGAAFALAFGTGFHAPEPSPLGDNRWLREPRGRIAFAVGRSGRFTIDLRMRSFAVPRDVVVLVDGREVSRARVGDQRFDRYLADVRLSRGRHTITLVPDPGSRRVSDVVDLDDPRRVSVMVGEDVAITRRAPDATP